MNKRKGFHMVEQKKTLGFWSLTALVAGNTIGSGILFLPITLSQYGSISIFSWIITGIGAVCIALVFAQLSNLKPHIGGPYIYSRDAFGDFTGFSIAYLYWVSIWIGKAAALTALISYLSFLWPQLLQNHWMGFGICMLVLWSMTLLHLFGFKLIKIVQLGTTLLQLAPLLVVAIIGIFFIHPHNLIDSFNVSGQSNWSALNSAAMLTFWAFLGLESATIPATEEIENPKKNIPKATIISMLSIALLYILGTITIMGIIPIATLQKSAAPFVDTATILFGKTGGLIMAFCTIMAFMASLNGWILLQGQVPLAAARDNLFFPLFAKTFKKNIPAFGLIISSTLVSLVLMMTLNKTAAEKFHSIISLAIFLALIMYFYTVMAHIIFAIKNKKQIGKKMTASILLTLGAFIYIMWAFVGIDKTTFFDGTLFAFSSVPLYVLLKYKSIKSEEKS
jgi:basic amino acid/polyamine antiporter, APA family